MESNKELKNCPNCNERISVHDVQCPYCKYIDDKRYKKENDKLKKKKKDTKLNEKKLKKKLNPSKKTKQRNALLVYAISTFLILVCVIILVIKRFM
ncbi:MAG: hypothetical protein MR550_04820 [Bacilli bacterium]|nr:hypothetical protein [Bacilli bacterium]